MYEFIMQQKPRHRLATDAPLRVGAEIALEGNQAHYLTTVLRLAVGDRLAMFNRTDGEWLVRIADIAKKKLTVTALELLRPASASSINLTICFAPIKGGRLETIIEKATELGASVLQPVITSRTIVDKVNLERANLIAREAAEQCERVDWPEIRPPVKFEKLLGDWPADMPLIYGDESGASGSIARLLSGRSAPEGGEPPLTPSFAFGSGSRHKALRTPPSSEESCVGHGPSREAESFGGDTPSGASVQNQDPIKFPMEWGILVGPEGGFTPEEFALLKRIKAAKGVGLGPRILRADTAVITLTALTLAAWGDWDQAPRFNFGA